MRARAFFLRDCGKRVGVFIEDGAQVGAVEYRSQFSFLSGTVAMLPKACLDQLSLLLLWLLHTNISGLLPLPKEAHLKFVCISAAFLMHV